MRTVIPSRYNVVMNVSYSDRKGAKGQAKTHVVYVEHAADPILADSHPPHICHEQELRHEWAYWLRPHDLSDFELYREQIKAQIFINESYFHEWFIDALQWYPELHYNEFRIKISIDIKEGEINVANVILEALKETGPRDGGPKGKIALAFKARFSGGTVGFNLGVDVPLEGEELQPKMGKDGLPWYHDRDPYSAKAQEIVNLLSDVNGEQLMSGTWKLSPDIFQKFIRRRHPNRFTRLIQLFCNYDNKNIAPKVEDLQEKQVRVLEVEDEEEEEAPWERRQ